MKKRIVVLTLLLTVGTFVLAGCGRNNTGTQSGSTQNSTSASQAENTQNSASASQTENTQNSTSASQTESTQNSSSTSQTEATRISMEEARRAALERVPGAAESDIRIHLEMDDRLQVYDGEIIYNQIEYDFEIDAETGEFLEWSQEPVEYLD